MSELDFIEACYAETPTEAAWALRLAAEMARVVPDALGVIAAKYRVDSSGLSYQQLVGDALQPSSSEDLRRGTQKANQSAQRELMLARSFAAGRPHAVLLSDWPPELSAPFREPLPWDDADCIGFFGSLQGAQGYLISPGKSGSWRLTSRRREQFTRLSEHLAAGYWLHTLRAQDGAPQANTAAAVSTPDGRLLRELEGAPELSQRLVDAVRGMDRARCRRKKSSPREAVELWQGLIAGQYTLVESFERDGRRLILALRCRTPRPALTEREAAVARAAASGAANKAIASDLGLATSTVGVHIASALRKLGCPSRRALSHWLAPAVCGGASELEA
jgi:DNA-binding CsgD family transcriptional regulator